MTIPKKLAGGDDFVIIPKKELDTLVERADVSPLTKRHSTLHIATAAGARSTSQQAR